MKQRSTHHSTFVIERTFDAVPARVFAAFSDPVAKARWFSGPDEWQQARPELDFRVGGRERVSGGPKGGRVHTFNAIYQDIVPEERIVYTYEMLMDDARMSVSLATFEFMPVGKGTKLVYTEQGVYLDGTDSPKQREEGTRGLFDKLDASLAM